MCQNILAETFHYLLEYIDEMEFITFLKHLVIIKRNKAQAMLEHAQCVSIGTNGNSEAWDTFMAGLGMIPTKFADLKEALDVEISQDDIKKQIAAMSHLS